MINSQTSGGDEEQQFITHPDRYLEQNPHWDAVVGTPSLCTGVSIESNYFQQVFGIFYGVITDADVAQGLSRVRQPIQRTVWCAQRGLERSDGCDSTVPVKQRCWSVRREGHKGEKLRVYGVDPTEWAEIQVILDRRRTKRGAIADPSRSPFQLNNDIRIEGDLETEKSIYEWEETCQPKQEMSVSGIEIEALVIYSMKAQGNGTSQNLR